MSKITVVKQNVHERHERHAACDGAGCDGCKMGLVLVSLDLNYVREFVVDARDEVAE